MSGIFVLSPQFSQASSFPVYMRFVVIELYYIVDSKILKIHSEIFSISSLVKISIT